MAAILDFSEPESRNSAVWSAVPLNTTLEPNSGSDSVFQNYGHFNLIFPKCVNGPWGRTLVGRRESVFILLALVSCTALLFIYFILNICFRSRSKNVGCQMSTFSYERRSRRRCLKPGAYLGGGPLRLGPPLWKWKKINEEREKSA